MEHLEKWIGRISAVFASLVLLAMMGQIVVDVVLRGTWGAGFPATAELVSRYYMVAISFLPLALTEIKRRHIEATIFTDRLQGRARQTITFLGFAVALVVFALMAWGSVGEAMRQTARRAYVEVGTGVFPTWPSYWIVSVSFGLMGLVVVLRLIELLLGRFHDSAHDPLEEIDSTSGEGH
ncbi:TRAP transporter small permease [Pararhodospirillum oryzae]|uniref:TRAP transporter small permease protein n=1 Tax=Pararhodospirillum oryzae TaxID=478448 RepID=A0A512H487_9PROT|nr:TRAP transporter small permease [Pararhodospirillum oryzae]GEO80228.1 C4-dicarboxylate ABC transporter substrate-binding protein [Pararhodospirillum oryzae]